MAINGIVQYTSGFLPYILLFTQAHILVWFDGTIIDISTILLQRTTTVVMLGYDWWLCMVINISVQYNGGILPDITVDPRLLPLGNPVTVKYHVVVASYI